jgi:hypothetical protein
VCVSVDRSPVKVRA